MLRLKVVASENALPSLGGGLFQEPMPPPLPPPLSENPHGAGGSILFIYGAVNDIFLPQDPTPRHCSHSLEGGKRQGRLGWQLGELRKDSHFTLGRSETLEEDQGTATLVRKL